MTRTLKITAFALVSVLVLWACGGGGGAATTPSDAAKAFLEAVQNHDWSTAKANGTSKTAEELDKLKDLGGEAGKKAVTIKSENIDGETATVTYTLEGSEEEKVLNLVKDGDSWKAEATKLELSGDSGDGGLGDLENSLDEAFEELGDEMENAADEAGEE